MSFENIRNSNEPLVAAAINKIWETSAYCKCEKCKGDVYALALGMLKPHYVNSAKGSIYVGAGSPQIRFDIVKAAIEAMEIVNKNPRHYV